MLGSGFHSEATRGGWSGGARGGAASETSPGASLLRLTLEQQHGRRLEAPHLPLEQPRRVSHQNRTQSSGVSNQAMFLTCSLCFVEQINSEC